MQRERERQRVRKFVNYIPVLEPEAAACCSRRDESPLGGRGGTPKTLVFWGTEKQTNKLESHINIPEYLNKTNTIP